MNKKLLAAGAVILGIIFVIISGIYFFKTAGNLPHFFPGFEAGSTHMHLKHAIASLILGLALFIYAWFASAKEALAPTRNDISAE